MIHIEPLDAIHLPQVQELINVHLNAVVPGCSLSDSYIESILKRNPGQTILDPWVAERKTLCALDGGRVTAVAHLLNYDTRADVSSDYQGAGDIAWFLAWPGATDAAAALLNAAFDTMATWKARQVYCWDSGIPANLYGNGVADVWPHITAMLRDAGFEQINGREEAIYAGPLMLPETVIEPPVPAVTLQRKVGEAATRFAAVVEGTEIGHGDCVEELTRGGTLPALCGWAELAELWIEPEWRDKGVGGWIVSHIVEWLLFARCDRIVLFVDADDEAAGAGRFYNRWGWTPFTRRTLGWKLPPEQLPSKRPT